MDNEEITPLPKLFLLDSKAHHKRCNGIKIPHEVMSTVRAKQFFVQSHPGWQGLAEPSLTAHRDNCKHPSPLPERAGSQHYFHLGL